MNHEIGEIVVGEVTGIQSYGAFVRLENNEQGLIHISEISSYFVKSVSNFVKVGQTIKVKIIDILKDKNLYRLSLKQVESTPRQNVRPVVSKLSGKKKYKVPYEQQDFTPLINSLNGWIDEAKQKYGEKKDD